MERVTGIGGIFFHGKNPYDLAVWYEQHLGIPQTGRTYEEGSWWQDEGPTVFAPESTEKFGRSYQTWRVNFRVRDLEAMMAQLRTAGIEVTADPEVYPNGRFAHLHDPEGNLIELWEAGGTDGTRPPSIS